MKEIMLFLVLASAIFGANIPNRYLTADITAEDIADSYRMRIPNWIEDFEKESVSYHGTRAQQTSLEVMRKTGLGNCQAFAKLGAYYALKAGWDCHLITVAGSGLEPHMFMCATNGKMFWATSNKKFGEFDSFYDANLRLCGFGRRIIQNSKVTLADFSNYSTGLITTIDDRTINIPRIGGGLIPESSPAFLVPQKR